MEKATITIGKNKQGGLYGNIKIENGKSMPFTKFIIEEKYNGKECEIERINGQIEKIIVEGESLKLKDSNSINTKKINKKQIGGYSKQSESSHQQEKTDIFKAKAPYNFVPLNKVIISYDDKTDRFNRYNEDGNTGYINIEIEAKTPIFISESDHDGDYYKFYNQAGKFRIPGSSLRGLIRTMVEITSWGKFEFFNDDYLYYRTFTDKARSVKKSIGEHIRQDYSNKSECEKFDIPTSIFGTEKKKDSKDSFAPFASRVFFEDAFLTDDSLDKEEQENKIPQTLAGPKPTSFQLYLDQNGINDINKLKHYNDDADIRGNKLYWHKDLEDWKTETFNEKMDKKIRPINQGAKFKGKIRFDNLSDIELGALLFAVDLPEHYAHKIGMGKPLGLGSIRINAKLYLSDRQKRYKDLFAEWNGLQEKSGEIKNIKLKFEQFILKELDNGTGKYKSLWDTERLKEFARMLDFSNKPNKEKVSYMKLDMDLKLNEFKNRDALPRPIKIN